MKGVRLLRVAVVGVGNIGLNLLQSLRQRGVAAVGIEISAARRAALQKQQVQEIYASASEVGRIDVWVLTTSTGPQLSHLFDAISQLTPEPGALLSVESTLPVGTMEQLAEHFSGRGYRVGHDLYLAHVPHRILFGVEASVFDAARVVGGVTPACQERALAFYQPLVRELHPVADVRLAELSKIVENAARYYEIALAEELYGYCEAIGLDFQALRAAVNTKGNVQLLAVDFGIGGECLPKDIGFLQQALQSPLLAAAIEADMAHRIRLQAAAAGHKRILIRGITFKPGYPDTRFSPAVALALALQTQGKEVYVYDPLVGPEAVAQLGLRWGDPGGHYDLIYERPLTIRTGKGEQQSGGHSSHGQ